MYRVSRLLLRYLVATLPALALIGILLPPSLLAAVVTLKSGVRLEGRMGVLGKLGDDPFKPAGAAGADGVKMIGLLDDDLRRTFFPKRKLETAAPAPSSHVSIKIPQRIAIAGRRVGGVGPIIKVTPFDQWGHRVFTMNTHRGPLDIIQAITEITPLYTKVEGWLGQNAYVWDMRIATSSLSRKTISQIVRQYADPKDSAARLEVVTLLIQSDRYRDARLELEEIQRDFPELTGLDKKIDELRQAGARRLIKEIQLRRQSGQDALALSMLQRFPAKGVADETLIQVRDLIAEYEKQKQQGTLALKLFQEHLDKIEDAALKEKIEPIQKEIAAELNLNTLNRMADYLRLSDDDKIGPQEKLALAISGWLLGSGNGEQNLAVALSLFEVRNLVQDYLRTEHAHERTAALEKIKSQEGGTPKYLSLIVAHMKPAIVTPPPNQGLPGKFDLTVSGLAGEPDITYHIQLPPEYDPYRRYPCVVTLNGAGATAQKQLDWWAGSYSEQAKSRLGQATRRGYIVIAPKWTLPGQRQYEYSAREHAAVLYSLRDACRRFSIDSDRVFLSGHSMGGDAAWDIGLAHPDLWAGVMPIVATADKYITRYWENARRLPMYFVAGQFDGDKISRNSTDWNRYLTLFDFDAIMVEFKGRGHEHFQDEIQRLFGWMERQKRDFFRRDFKTVSMRPWDNFFWWAELSDFPKNSMVVPKSWPRSRARPAITTGKILETNGLLLRSGAGKATVYLAPEMLDLSSPLTINGKRVTVQPSPGVLLEDVRTRCDRQHPFWSKVELINGRVR